MHPYQRSDEFKQYWPNNPKGYAVQMLLNAFEHVRDTGELDYYGIIDDNSHDAMIILHNHCISLRNNIPISKF